MGENHGCGSPAPQRPWEESIPATDREVLRRAMRSSRPQLGPRPVLLVIDVLYGFTGTAPMPILQAIEEYPTSCGTAAWHALPRIRMVIDAFRRAGRPVIWTRGDEGAASRYGGATTRAAAAQAKKGRPANEIHVHVAPQGDEDVIVKSRASAFFATPLPVYLRRLEADSVVLVGSTTSGCVRASAVDSFSWGHPTFVVHDCCFDRSKISHDVSLFDLNSKYATVVSCDELLRSFQRRES